MKTAVEWLIEEYFGSIENCTPRFRKHIKQALAMEKEDIIIVFVEVSKANHIALGGTLTDKDILDFKEIAEIYYYKTYETKED